MFKTLSAVTLATLTVLAFATANAGLEKITEKKEALVSADCNLQAIHPAFAEAVSVNRTVFKNSKDKHIVEYINNSIALEETVTIEDIRSFRNSCKPSTLMETLTSRYENKVDPFVFDQETSFIIRTSELQKREATVAQM